MCRKTIEFLIQRVITLKCINFDVTKIRTIVFKAM